MSEVENTTPDLDSSDETKPGLMGSFGSLPGGVQRIIIAVLVIIVLVVAMLLRDMIRTEEKGRGSEESEL